MKKTTLIAMTALAAIAMLVPAGSAMAQSSANASATATATIITPITLTNTGGTGLRFGNVVASTAAGTIVVASDGTRSWTGGATGISGLPVGAALFGVTGGANRTFTITLPSSTTITDGTNDMTVDTFTSSLASPATLNGSGTASFNVGGTLTVNAGQVAGSYTGTFSVTVAYN
jgi:hypothetical protein